jgi:hypothetical protein
VFTSTSSNLVISSEIRPAEPIQPAQRIPKSFLQKHVLFISRQELQKDSILQEITGRTLNVFPPEPAYQNQTVV